MKNRMLNQQRLCLKGHCASRPFFPDCLFFGGGAFVNECTSSPRVVCVQCVGLLEPFTQDSLGVGNISPLFFLFFLLLFTFARCGTLPLMALLFGFEELLFFPNPDKSNLHQAF